MALILISKSEQKSGLMSSMTKTILLSIWPVEYMNGSKKGTGSIKQLVKGVGRNLNGIVFPWFCYQGCHMVLTRTISDSGIATNQCVIGPIMGQPTNF